MFASARGKQQKQVRQLHIVSRTVIDHIPYYTFRDCRVHIISDNLSRNSCIPNRPFPHYAPLSKHKETRTRLGWTISYKSLYSTRASSWFLCLHECGKGLFNKGCFSSWSLAIASWACRIYGTHCNDFLERPPNNSFPAFQNFSSIDNINDEAIK